ncbi:MAG TPA: hypothetical protein VM511_09615 [Luteolibacter sp.]|nr:hypothetical protein [Luteolibacter sp.]
MKPNVLFPVITAILGFGAGWVLKPATAPEPVVRKSPPARPAVPPPTEVAAEPAPPPVKRTQPAVRPAGAADDETLKNQLKSRDEAKLARLVEALNLNDEQKAVFLNAMNMAEGILNPEATLDPSKMLETALNAASGIEKAISGTLTPEQAAAFAALRKRSEENTIESTTQNRMGELAKLSDLSPEQREKLAGIIRENVRTSHEGRPAGLDLVLDTSVLPLGNTFIANSAVDNMIFSQGSALDPATQRSYIDLQRKNLDSQFEDYKDVLTPAQQERLRIDIEERKQALDRVGELLR